MEPNSTSKPNQEFRIYTRNLPHFEQLNATYFITFSTYKGSVLLDSAKDILFASCKHHSGKKYFLYACVVMDTHVHCVVRPLKRPTGGTPVPPLAYFSLAEITHSIKSYSSHRINKHLGIEGSIWQDENYDRIIRDDKEFNEKMNYIIFNPVKAGFVEQYNTYKWLYINPEYQLF